MDEEDSETSTIVSEPLKGKQKVAENLVEPEWEKDMKKQMNQLKDAMKKLGPNHDFIDLDLEEDEPLPPKYKFPDIKKYDGTDDPHLHLRQYVTFMKPTGLTKAQIIKQFLMSLAGAAVKWYYTLDAHVQQS